MSTEQFVGTWRLVSSVFRRPDGGVFFPYGENATGVLMYDSHGAFAAQLMKPERPEFATRDMFEGSAGEVKAAFDGYVAYFGEFEVDEAAGSVAHHVRGSLFPNWIGQDQTRFYEFAGARLTLTTPPILAGASTMTGVLTWERARDQRAEVS